MANPSGAKSTHWRVQQREVKKWHRLVWAAVSGRKPVKPLERFQLRLTRFSSVAPDYDGLVRGFKSVVDGLKVCGVIADDRFENTGVWDCRWEKTKPKTGKIRIEIEELNKSYEPERRIKII